MSSRQNTVFEYIQEVQVKTTGIPAEFGGALGGVISAVTKSGGNIFTGEGHYYFDGSTLSAGPVKRLVLSPIDDKTVTYVQDDKPHDIRHEFGGSLGGPIVRDRVFFFGSFSPRVNTRTNEYMFSSGTDPGEITRTTKLMQTFGKLSVSSRRVNAYGTGLATSTYVKGTLLRTTVSVRNSCRARRRRRQPNTERGFEQMQVNTTANVDVVVSNGAYATFRGGYFHDRYSDTGIPNTRAGRIRRSRRRCWTTGPRFRRAFRTQFDVNTPRAQITNFDTTTRRTFNADYNHTFQGGGWHTLKGGAGYQHIENDVNSLYPGGYVLICWDRSTGLTVRRPIAAPTVTTK